jgi:hypothetical protein
MTCPSCTHDNDAARRYCGQCGCNLKPVCVRCGFSNAAPDRFCGGCGLGLAAYATQLADGDAPPQPLARPVAPSPPVRLAAVTPAPQPAPVAAPAKLAAVAAPAPAAAPVAESSNARAPEMLSALDLEFLIERPKAPEPESTLPKARITQDDLDDLFEANS